MVTSNDMKWLTALAWANTLGIRPPSRGKKKLYDLLDSKGIEWVKSEKRWQDNRPPASPIPRPLGVRIVGDNKLAEHFDALGDLVTDYLSENGIRIAHTHDNPSSASRWLVIDCEVIT